MLQPTVTAVDDTALPSLAFASCPASILPRLARVLNLETESVTTLSCRVDVLKHWPGKRCTLRFWVNDVSRPDAPANLVVGKVYRRVELAQRVHHATALLRTELAEPDSASVPAPLAFFPDLALALQSHAAGGLLSLVKRPFLDDRPFAHAGRWLAAFHDARPVRGLRSKPLNGELDKIEQCFQILDAHLPPQDRRRVHTATGTLRELCRQRANCSTAMTHRDFYPGNVLWDGQKITVIDFDWLAIGDPAVDVGGFLAQVEKLSHRETGRWDGYAASSRAFYDAYAETSGHGIDTGLPYALGAAFMNLAADEVRRQRSPGWQEHASVLSGRMCDVMDTGEWSTW